MARRGGVGDTYGAGAATIDQWIANIRSLPEMLNAAAPQIGEALLAEFQRTAAAGTTPEGEPWAPTKKGNRPLANAASSMQLVVSGNVIIIKITDHHVFHQFGAGSPARHILPSGGLPDRLGNAIRKGIVDMGVEWMTRGGRHDRGSGGVKMRPGGG